VFYLALLLSYLFPPAGPALNRNFHKQEISFITTEMPHWALVPCILKQISVLNLNLSKENYSRSPYL